VGSQKLGRRKGNRGRCRLADTASASVMIGREHKLSEGLEYGAKEAKEKEIAVSGSILIWQSFLAFRCLYFGRLYITLRKADKR